MSSKRPCVHCGEMYAPYSEHKNYAMRFCSRKCSNEAKKARAVASYPPRETILALYEEGLTDRELGARYGHSHQWAFKVRVHHGITVASKPRKRRSRRIHSAGYVVVGDKLEHRTIMEKKIGRPLRTGEVVHHIDGDKANNDPGNLALFPSHSEHMHAERHQPVQTKQKSQARSRRDWTEPRRKVEFEQSCRVCGRSGVKVDAAHIIPRSRVGPDEGEHYDNIVPLCNERCHPEYDLGGLDLLPFLTLTEQAKAVELVGMAEAYQRLTNTRLAA